MPPLPEYWTRSLHSVAVRIRNYSMTITEFEAHRHRSRAAPSQVLFQYGIHDEWFSRESAEELYSQTSFPNALRWYEEGHDLEIPEVVQDSHAWLRSNGLF